MFCSVRSCILLKIRKRIESSLLHYPQYVKCSIMIILQKSPKFDSVQNKYKVFLATARKLALAWYEHRDTLLNVSYVQFYFKPHSISHYGKCLLVRAIEYRVIFPENYSYSNQMLHLWAGSSLTFVGKINYHSKGHRSEWSSSLLVMGNLTSYNFLLPKLKPSSQKLYTNHK